MNIEKLEPKILLDNIRSLLKKPYISFIQIGVNDGITHDIANTFLNENDFGFFIEPIEETFNIMKLNKQHFKNVKFIKKAILPEILKNNNTINLLSDDNKNEGASIGNFNKEKILKQVKVDTVTITNFLLEESIADVDFVFCDAESIDHLIIIDLINQIKPNVLFFETCWWCTNDYELEISDGSKIIIPSRKYMKEFLDKNGYVVIDYWEHNEFRREDMIAIKKEIIENEN
jgi:FkbM family methyltransferase